MDSKLGHLLQPIKNLASNWNVNVAEELEDYLVSLWLIPKCIVMNFAILAVTNFKTVHHIRISPHCLPGPERPVIYEHHLSL